MEARPTGRNGILIACPSSTTVPSGTPLHWTPGGHEQSTLTNPVPDHINTEKHDTHARVHLSIFPLVNDFGASNTYTM